ncbi:MAG: NAD(+) diphosphatase [Thiolinea sp.]
MDQPSNQPLHYTGLHLDRGDQLRRHPEQLEQLWDSPACRVLPLLENRHLFSLDPCLQAVCVSPAALQPHLEQAQFRCFLGSDASHDYFAVEMVASSKPALCEHFQGKFIDLRSIGSTLPYQEAALLAYARGMIHWRRQHRYCSRCAAPLFPGHGGHSLQCSHPDCALQTYPRTDPAVIMLIERRDASGTRQCLLGRHPNWQPGLFSTLAGFVEPGESLEDAVRREVMEEAGIMVGEVTYAASQPWPFPSSIMLGFYGQALSHVIDTDPQELAEAQWFSKAELRHFGEWGDTEAQQALPRRDSIARYLINNWLDQPD